MPPVLESPAPTKQKRYLSQDKRITPKMQRYADLRAQGLTQGAAAKQAGYSTKSSACKADQHPLVQEYLSDVQKRVRATTGYVVATAMNEALAVIELAKQQKNPMAYCKAVELRAKLSGLLIDRVEVVSIDLSGSLAKAQQRVLTHLPQAEPQADPEPTG